MGVHPFSDPTISNDFEEIRLSIDVREFHDYAAQWTPDQVDFFVDGRCVRTVNKSPRYPMQFMLGIYEFGDQNSSSGPYPKRFTVDSFRAYQPVGTA
jgi:beta-glucanase (GH16 family)